MILIIFKNLENQNSQSKKKKNVNEQKEIPHRALEKTNKALSP